MLLEFPTSKAVLGSSVTELTARISHLCISRSEQWAQEKAQLLISAALRNPFGDTAYQSHLISLELHINLLLQYKEHLSKLEKQIDVLAKELEEYKIILSIPGIGEKIAATIIPEIGGIDRFNHPKKLVAFAGVDPRVFSSGKFQATINRITKRGSSRLRHALYLAVLCAIKGCLNKRLKAFYDQKRAEGKLFKVTVIACANKLLHWIYTLLKR